MVRDDLPCPLVLFPTLTVAALSAPQCALTAAVLSSRRQAQLNVVCCAIMWMRHDKCQQLRWNDWDPWLLCYDACQHDFSTSSLDPRWAQTYRPHGWDVVHPLPVPTHVCRWVARRPRRTSVIVRARPEEPPAAPRPLPDRDGPHFLQQLRALQKPADSGRNAFARAWKKQRQIQARTRSRCTASDTLRTRRPASWARTLSERRGGHSGRLLYAPACRGKGNSVSLSAARHVKNPCVVSVAKCSHASACARWYKSSVIASSAGRITLNAVRSAATSDGVRREQMICYIMPERRGLHMQDEYGMCIPHMRRSTRSVDRQRRQQPL